MEDGGPPNKAPTRINLHSPFSILQVSRPLPSEPLKLAVVGRTGSAQTGVVSSLPQAKAARLPRPCKKVEVVWRAGIPHC